MTKCYQRSFEFPRVNRRIVEARFDGGDITSDGGALLLRQADRLTGLSDSIARALSDPRRQASCDHDVPGLVRQRLYAIALGYEDLNDHDGLRQDVALQTAVERDQWLASASTLCRFENRADRETAWRLYGADAGPDEGCERAESRHAQPGEVDIGSQHGGKGRQIRRDRLPASGLQEIGAAVEREPRAVFSQHLQPHRRRGGIAQPAPVDRRRRYA